MSDDLFSGLLKSFKDSFERGWNAPSAHGVRSRPNFWNPFHSWRDEEERQLRDLYVHAKQAFDASPFSDEEHLDEAVISVVVKLCKETGREADDPAIAAIIGVTAQMLRTEFFTFPEVHESDWQSLDLGAANLLRGDLERKLACLADWEGRLEIALSAITDLWLALLARLPTRFARDDPSSLSGFSTELVSLIDDPHAFMTAVLGHFISNEDIQEQGLFSGLSRQLYRNVLEASGVFVDPYKPLASYDTEKPVLPEHCAKEMAVDVAERYFRHTALLDVFARPVPFELPIQARFEHCHVLGGTGHGKTQCLQYMIHEDLIRAVGDKQQSVVVIDSQGSLIRNLLSCALFDPDEAESLADRLVLIDPSDIDRPPALNLFNPGLDRLESYSPQQREVAFNSLVDIYGRFFGALLGAELTGKQSAVFRYLARLMLTIDGATVHTLIALMDDARPFASQIANLDATARRFFEKEFSRKGFNATRQQIKDRLYAVLSIPTFDRLFSAPKSKVNFFDCLNSGSIVLVDTAKGLLKDEGTAIFGRFMLALIEHAITERANMEEAGHSPVFLYMDEAHEYFDDTVETLLVEARKFHCGLTLAHQNLTQLSPRLRQIFMGNTSVKLAGGITEADARALAADMRATSDFLLSMRKHENANVSEFALSVRNVTPRALKVSVPLGYLESHPRLDPGQRETLLVRNRERIGYTPQQDTWEPVPEPVEPVEEPEESVPEEREPKAVPEPDPGHREIQERIKRAAQAHGFATTIEQTVLDGAGNVDVSLEKGDLRIACEVSVTTKPDHEQGNVEKCLAAGYGQVWLTSPDPARLDALRSAIAPALPKEVRDRVRFFSPDDLIGELDRLAALEPPSRSTVLGYEVVVTHGSVDTVQATERRKRLGAVLKRLRRQTRDKR